MTIEFEARRVVEALRSGVPSRSVGQYFSSARPEILREITEKLEAVSETRSPGGMLVAGKYGEGKTHLLNTVFHLAHENNMVVSFVSLSKETPFDKLYLVYQKLMNNTYLPKRAQPGLGQLFDGMTPGSPTATEMLLYAGKHLQTDKLYFLLRSYLSTEDPDEKFMLLADLEGDFVGNAQLKQIYKRIFSQKVSYSVNFSKTRHTADYLAFFSHLFVQLGYNGWVILFDETELIGRLGKKARLSAYKNMADFLFPGKDSRLEATFSMFALGASYAEDVIESKHEYENLAASVLADGDRGKVERVLDRIAAAPQLLPLTKEEIEAVVLRVQELHGRAYGWDPRLEARDILGGTEGRGYLLRTRIRAAIELLDQLYQYGKAGSVQIDELGQASFEEDVPALDGLLDGE